MDKQVLDDSFAAMEETFRAKSKVCQLSVRSVILQNRTMKLAAAAVIVIVSGLLLTRDKPMPDGPNPEPPNIARSPTKIVSMISLRTAYQTGGWDALDQQFQETLETFGPGPSSISVQQLLEGLNAF
ncbi:MAG: hypothetical protein P8Z79_11550 [Sedimentisphaerales bacterium]